MQWDWPQSAHDWLQAEQRLVPQLAQHVMQVLQTPTLQRSQVPRSSSETISPQSAQGVPSQSSNERYAEDEL